MNFILAVRLGIRTRAGHHTHGAVDICDIYVTGPLVSTSQCLFQSLWCEQKDHLTDCYFCSTKTDDHISKSKHTIVYPNTPDDSSPIPTPPQQWTLHEEKTTSTSPED